MTITQKEEYRLQYAGQAMQAMITASWSSPEAEQAVFASAKKVALTML